MLRIVSVNDVYTLENLPRLKSLVLHHKPDLVVLAGDFVAPSLLSSIDAGRGMVDCMNDVGVTHVVLGNHEDDIPGEELRLRLAELRATCLGTNVSFSSDRALDLPRHVFVSAGGRTYGLVGIVTNDPTVYRSPHPFGGATLAAPNLSAIAEAQAIAASCDTLIPITHQPVADDEALADGPVKFPIVLGGHEHTPMLIDHRGTWIVKAGSNAENAVIVEVDGAKATVRLEAVAAYPEDPELRARVDRHLRSVREVATATLIELPAPLSSIGSRSQQTTFGTFLCSHLRDALGADIALFNGGGIRGARTYPDRLTYGDVETEIPFDNEVAVANLPGEVVLAAVAASRAKESGAFLQVDDRFGTIDPKRTYKVAIVRQLLFGLDHIEPLVAWAAANPVDVPAAGSGCEPKMLLLQALSRQIWKELGGFDRIDLNHDERVTPSELATALAAKRGTAGLLADIVFRAMDVNGDRVITRQEG